MSDPNITNYLDAYCERAGDAGLWAEPLNAITNLAFIIAAYYAARALRGNHFKTHWDLWLLTLTLFSIGVGSGLWHLYATQETMLADVIPIGIFIHLFFYAALRRAFELSWFKSLMGVGAFIAVSYVAGKYLPPDMLNGSVMYLPAISALALFTVLLKIKAHHAARGFAVALGVFILSITFRTLDLSICSTLPIGTHFLWHCFNAFVLYRLLLSLVHRP
ncbi:MAG: ceramidase domain-containing protein [Alphaproteobacteria bacterium]|nr:ceramidase domain-containing protein [Alphaproteobacteria bacterium]